jgi:hypothetical protein
MILTGQNGGTRKKSVPLPRCPQLIPNIPNTKLHENHFNKRSVDPYLRTGGRTHRRNKASNYAVTLLVEALLYKPEGYGFDSRWDLWDFSLPESFPWTTHPLTEMGIRSISWGKGGGCVGLALPSSCTDCEEIREALTSLSSKGLYRDSCTFIGIAVPLYAYMT